MRESSIMEDDSGLGRVGAGGWKDTGRSRAKLSKELRTRSPLPPGEVAGV
jgi:hypothetical protein